MPSTNQSIDDAIREQLSKESGKTYGEIEASVLKALSIKTELQDMAELMQLVPTGAVQGRWLEVFPEADTNAAALMSMMKRVAPTLRVEGSGSTSDIEYAGMLAGLGSFRNDPEANRMIYDAMLAKQQIMIDQAKLIQDFKNKKITGSELSTKLFELQAKSIFKDDAQRKYLTGSNPLSARAMDQQRTGVQKTEKGYYPVGTVLTKSNGEVAVKTTEGDDSAGNWTIQKPKGK